MISKQKKAEIEKYTLSLIDGVMQWYMTGAIDCAETRRNINKELQTVLPRVCSRFHMKMNTTRQLRAIPDGKGWFDVRMVEVDLKLN